MGQRRYRVVLSTLGGLSTTSVSMGIRSPRRASLSRLASVHHVLYLACVTSHMGA